MNKPIILKNPPDNWVLYLQKDHFIWLPKEKEYAMVLSPWQSFGVFGQLMIELTTCQEVQIWWVDQNGLGLNKQSIMCPCKENLSASPLSNQNKLDDLEKRVYALELNSPDFHDVMFQDWPSDESQFFVFDSLSSRSKEQSKKSNLPKGEKKPDWMQWLLGKGMHSEYHDTLGIEIDLSFEDNSHLKIYDGKEQKKD